MIQNLFSFVFVYPFNDIEILIDDRFIPRSYNTNINLSELYNCLFVCASLRLQVSKRVLIIMFLQQTGDFQQFDYGGGGVGGYDQSGGQVSYLSQQTDYTGSMFIPDTANTAAYDHAHKPSGFEDEPPLLEELGINPDHILQKTLTVLNPMRSTDASIAGDSDLAGPIVFAVAFGSFIMFR